MGTQYDAIVIGTGHAGPSLADRLGSAGLHVAILEGERAGGTCSDAQATCTGSLAASARVAQAARRAAEFGVQLANPVRVDLAQVNARAREIAEQSERGTTAWLAGMISVDLLRGNARFVGPHSIEVAGQRLEAPRIFINVGARDCAPELPGLSQVNYLTPCSLTGLTVAPRHLIVLGGNGSGVESAQLFRRFGSAVTIIESGPRLVDSEDRDLSASVQELLESEGVHVRCDAQCVSVATTRAGVRVQTSCRGGTDELDGTHLLVSAGRVPDTASLNLSEAGVHVDARGAIVVDEQLRASSPGIWALGDCHDRAAFAHSAHNDAELLAANLLDGESRRASDRLPHSSLILDPPLGRVGMTEDEARASGRRVLVGRWPMSNVARARESSATHGFIKILVDADSEELLGAAILGLGGDEVVQGLLQLMYARAPYSLLSRTIVHIHSTVSERIPATLRNLVPLD